MKAFALLFVVAATVAAVAWSQPPRNDRSRDDGRPAPPPVDPIVELFDSDGDGEISRSEIENAVTILRKLDRDGNGRLTRNELPRPPRPEDDRRQRGGRGDRPAPRGDDGQSSDRSTHRPALSSSEAGTKPTDRTMDDPSR